MLCAICSKGYYLADGLCLECEASTGGRLVLPVLIPSLMAIAATAFLYIYLHVHTSEDNWKGLKRSVTSNGEEHAHFIDHNAAQYTRYITSHHIASLADKIPYYIIRIHIRISFHFKIPNAYVSVSSMKQNTKRVKIMMSFLQCLTAVSSVYDIPWPGELFN